MGNGSQKTYLQDPPQTNWANCYQLGPHRGYLLLTVQVLITTYCRIIREQQGRASPIAGPGYLYGNIDGYCEFIILGGIQILENFVSDRTKPRNQKFNEYLSPYTHILTIAGDKRTSVSMKIHFFNKPRKQVSTNLNEFTPFCVLVDHRNKTKE